MHGPYSPELLERIAARFRILGDPTRLAILNTLRDGERTVSAIVEETGASQANVSKHLAMLHRERLVSRRKEGLNAFYSIADAGLFTLCEHVCDALETEARQTQAVVTQGRRRRRTTTRRR